jgi:mannitol 2-dehydrogenase
MSAPQPLSMATLAHHAARVAVPSYDRSALAPGVLHISVGSFHRAHQAVAFDDLAALGHTGWGVVGVGLHRPHVREALEPQDGLYTVVERGAEGDRARVVGSLVRILFAPRQWHEVLHALTDPRLALVTLTVTGAGYKLRDGQIDHDDPEVAQDLADPGRPASAIGHLVEGLARRRAVGLPPFTVLSCDNLPDNGGLARRAVVGLAAARDPELAAWIEAEGAFPSSMVDRITPQTSDADRRWVAGRFGVEDRWPVITEPFSEWVVEDAFSAARPPLEEVGVRVVADVGPAALRKTRMLNAAHCVLGHLGVLAGAGRTDEAMADPLLRAAVRRMMADEVAPLLPHEPGVDLDAYRAVLEQRLDNPVLGDQLSRLCRNASDKVPTHVLTSLAQARAAGRPHDVLLLGAAAWCAVLRTGIAVDDPEAPRLRALARESVAAWVRGSGAFGAAAEDPELVGALEHAVEALEAGGAHGALAAALGETAVPA